MPAFFFYCTIKKETRMSQIDRGGDYMRKKKLLTVITAFLLAMFFLYGCEDEEEVLTQSGQAVEGWEETPDEAGTWAIYWYLCGSDLESDAEFATMDLYELQCASLPENVQVIIETGGAREWYHEDVEAGQQGRYLYDSDGLTFLEAQPEADMGDPETLADFLSFCKENFPADHTMFLFWNHGGGSVSGAAFDEIYDYDSLTLDEMYQAFGSVYELSEENPPFDIVGFDTCLMATIDTAWMLSDVSHYLVASEEMEPGCGWSYDKWVQTLGDHPGIDGEALGQVICDSYMEGCEDIGMEQEATLSVVDLQKIQPLLNAYDDLGKEALTLACEDSTFFAEFGRRAVQTENYGGNTPDQGYTNMVDMGHLVRNSEDLLPETAQAVLDALEECVVYNVSGDYRSEATGLSCYYSYNGDTDDFDGFVSISASPAFQYLYDYELYGYMSDEGLAYMQDLGYEEEIPEITITQDNTELEDFPLYVDEDGNSVLEIGSGAASTLQAVYYQLCYVSEEDDIILLLGRDNDIYMDWDEGVFRDNFRGVWGAIDGCLCYMEIVYEGDDYNLYSVPILLNGDEYNLRVVYSYTDEEYSILGARRGIDDNGMADKNLVQLEPGDEITTLHYAMTISGDEEEPEQVPVDTITVTEDTVFTEEDLGDGNFVIFYEMVDMQDNSYYSDLAYFTVEDGLIYTETE